MASFPQPDPLEGPRARPGHFAFGILLVQLSFRCLAFSQHSAGPFGPILETELTSTATGLTVIDGGGGRAEIYLSVSSPPALVSYALSDTLTVDLRDTWRLQRPLTGIRSVDLDRDGAKEILGLEQGDPALVILRRRGASLQWTRIPLDAPYDRFLAADINNDRRTDLLMFGRTTAGICVLPGAAGGTFTSPRILFEDVSISDAALTDLNGDGIADLFLLNWLSNSLEVFFGIGNFVFSSQVTIDLGGEPAAIAISPSPRTRIVQVAVAFTGEPSVAIFRGNGAGEFSRMGSLSLPAVATGIQFSSLNGDQIPDLLVSLPEAVATSTGGKNGFFSPPMLHGLRTAPALWSAKDVSANRRTDLVFVERGGRRLAIALDGAPLKGPPPRGAYVVGPDPGGIAIADVTRDGLPDLVVSNRGSGTVSVLVNRRNSSFEGHRQSPVADLPGQVRTITPPSGPWTTVLTAHPRGEKICLLRISPDGVSKGFVSIPTGPDPRIIGALEVSPETGTRILIQNQESSRASATFSLFEQISASTFIERSFRSGAPEGGAWVSVADYGITGDREALVLLRMASRDSSQVALARTGEGLSVSSVKPLVMFPDSGGGPRLLLTADLNGDDRTDLLVARRSASTPALGVALSEPQSGAIGPVRWMQGVSMGSPDLIAVVDADQDGQQDVVYYDPARRTVLALYGLGGGELSAPKAVASIASAVGLAVGPLRSDGMNDLALVDPVSGYVRIFYDPF